MSGSSTTSNQPQNQGVATASGKPVDSRPRHPVHAEKRRRYRMQDIALIATTATRIDVAVDKLVQMQPSRAVLREVVRFLEMVKKPTTIIDQYCEIVGEPLFPKRGKKPPVVGMSRIYRAQVLPQDASEAFIRLPLGSLKAKKGDPIQADFEDGRIVVRISQVAS